MTFKVLKFTFNFLYVGKTESMLVAIFIHLRNSWNNSQKDEQKCGQLFLVEILVFYSDFLGF